MGPIRTRAESHALLRGGHFGTKLRNRRTLADLMNDPYSGPVAIRSWQVGFRSIFNVAQPALAADPRFAEGSAAEAILRSAMHPNSWEDFQILRDQFPDSMVEFSCYDICLGDRPHRNTLFWELRTNY